jgi:hypothetical protein
VEQVTVTNHRQSMKPERYLSEGIEGWQGVNSSVSIYTPVPLQYTHYYSTMKRQETKRNCHRKLFNPGRYKATHCEVHIVWHVLSQISYLLPFNPISCKMLNFHANNTLRFIVIPPYPLCIFMAQKNSVASIPKRSIPTEVSANFFVDRGCHVISVTNPYGRILIFLDRSRYYFFQVAPQLYSQG